MGRKGKDKRWNMHHKNNHHVSWKQNGWNTGDAPKVCTNCDFLPDTDKVTIHIPQSVFQVIRTLCKTIEVEWQVLLCGTEEGNEVKVDGYWIPLQEVGAASVKNLDVVDDAVITEKRIVASLHSHAAMSVFFSSTDEEDTNMSLIRHHIVFNNKLEYVAKSRRELPCGLAKFTPTHLTFEDLAPVPVVGIENIKKPIRFGFSTEVVKKDEPAPTEKKGKDVLEDLPMPEKATRWCPICDFKPEEDGGCSCKCKSAGIRAELPVFNRTNYEWDYVYTWKLKPGLLSSLLKESGFQPTRDHYGYTGD